MKNYFIYILRCAGGSYYTGVTNSIDYRIYEHQQGLIPGYTQTRRPLECVYIEQTSDIVAALEREKHIKRWSRKKKEALIRGNEPALFKLSKNRMKRHYVWKRKKQ